MQRDKVYLVDIIQAARLAVSYLADVSEETFASNTQLQDSVVRRIEVIGEAARRVSDETRAAYPDIPWREMIGMRNLAIHEYDAVDLQVVWATVQNDLPQLISRLQALVPEDRD